MLIVPARLRDIQSIDAGSAEVRAGSERRNGSTSTATRRAELAAETGEDSMKRVEYGIDHHRPREEFSGQGTGMRGQLVLAKPPHAAMVEGPDGDSLSWRVCISSTC